MFHRIHLCDNEHIFGTQSIQVLHASNVRPAFILKLRAGKALFSQKCADLRTMLLNTRITPELLSVQITRIGLCFGDLLAPTRCYFANPLLQHHRGRPARLWLKYFYSIWISGDWSNLELPKTPGRAVLYFFGNRVYSLCQKNEYILLFSQENRKTVLIEILVWFFSLRELCGTVRSGMNGSDW